MIRAHAAFVLCLGVACFTFARVALADDARPGESERRTLSVAGVEREYYIHYPKGYDRSKPVPLVLMFHGRGGDGLGGMNGYGWPQKANEEGFIAVFPTALGEPRAWLNFGPETDVEFVRQIIDTLESDEAIDPARIYVCGHSSGGTMSYRLACAMPERLAAVGVVAGVIGRNEPSGMVKQSPPKEIVPIIVFHGMEDAVVPYDDEHAKTATYPTLGRVADAVAFWREHGQLNEPIDREVTHDGNIIRETYRGATDRRVYTLYTIVDGSHKWPGQKVARAGPPANQDISATDLIWEFFANHARPARAAAYFPPAGSWETVTPESVGIDSAALAAALDLAGERDSTGVVVTRGGKIVAESYWQDWNEHTSQPIFSATKSMTATLVLMAIEEGKIKGVDQSMADYVPAWKGTDKETITIRHVLSMCSGIKVTLGEDLRATGDMFENTAALPLEHTPGTVWGYNTPVYRMLMRVIELATGESIEAYTKRKLTDPLGMADTAWVTTPIADTDRRNSLYIRSSPRDMARFGLLALRLGDWNGQRLLSRERFAEAVRPSQAMNESYGWLWWTNEGKSVLRPGGRRVESRMWPDCPIDAFAALGAADKKIYIVPSLDLVVTRHGGDAGDGFDNEFLGQITRAVTDAAR